MFIMSAFLSSLLISGVLSSLCTGVSRVIVVSLSITKGKDIVPGMVLPEPLWHLARIPVNNKHLTRVLTAAHSNHHIHVEIRRHSDKSPQLTDIVVIFVLLFETSVGYLHCVTNHRATSTGAVHFPNDFQVRGQLYLSTIFRDLYSLTSHTAPPQ